MFKTKNSQIIIDTLAAVDTFLLDYKYIQTSDCRAVESYSPARHPVRTLKNLFSEYFRVTTGLKPVFRLDKDIKVGTNSYDQEKKIQLPEGRHN